MKKFFGKLLCSTLVMVLLIGMAIPVQARDIHDFPTSFDFEYEVEFSLDLQMAEGNELSTMWQMVFDTLRDGIVMTSAGTVYSNGLAATMFYELIISVPVSMPVFGNISMDMDVDVTIRYWFDMDLNDLENPTLLVIYELELPAILQMLLAFSPAEFNYQFFVMDLSEFVALAAAELEAVVFEVSEEEWDELLAELAEALEDLLVLAGKGWEWFREVHGDDITISFDYSYGELENGYYAGFEFGFLLLDYASDGYLDIALTINGNVTNLDTAIRPVLPELVDGNYLDLIALFNDIIDSAPMLGWGLSTRP